eukprot:3876253-Amphidinium_carterae.1
MCANIEVSSPTPPWNRRDLNMWASLRTMLRGSSSRSSKAPIQTRTRVLSISVGVQRSSLCGILAAHSAGPHRCHCRQPARERYVLVVGVIVDGTELWEHGAQCSMLSMSPLL